MTDVGVDPDVGVPSTQPEPETLEPRLFTAEGSSVQEGAPAVPEIVPEVTNVPPSQEESSSQMPPRLESQVPLVPKSGVVDDGEKKKKKKKKHENVTLRKMSQGDECFKGKEDGACGTKGEAVPCSTDNVIAGTCNFRTIAVPIDHPLGNGEKEFDTFAKADSGIQIKLQLGRALANYSRAVSLLVGCSEEKWNMWWDYNGKDLVEPTAEWKKPTFQSVYGSSFEKMFDHIFEKKASSLDKTVASEFYSRSKDEESCPMSYINSKAKARGAAENAITRATKHLSNATMLYATLPHDKRLVGTALPYLTDFELYAMWAFSEVMGPSSRGYSASREMRKAAIAILRVYRAEVFSLGYHGRQKVLQAFASNYAQRQDWVLSMTTNYIATRPHYTDDYFSMKLMSRFVLPS